MTSSAGATHEAREVLDAACARANASRSLWLAENCRLSCGKAHVARQHKLAAGRANATLDLCDGDQAARAEMTKHQANRCLASQLCCLCPVLLDLGHINMGNEIVGIGALEYEHLDGVTGLGLLNERD
jgi:hypothetical protein